MPFKSRRSLLAALCLSALVPPLAHAQSQPAAWPAKPIRIVVAYPAGGVSDTVARALADKLAVQLGTPVVIENKAGASGSIGVDAGLAGFFHNKPDYSDEAWSKFCDRIRHGDAWLTEDGFYSSSGYGDGCYGVYAYKQDGEITALEVRFL